MLSAFLDLTKTFCPGYKFLKSTKTSSNMKSFLLHDGYDHLYNFQLILHLFVCEKCIQDEVIMKTVE